MEKFSLDKLEIQAISLELEGDIISSLKIPVKRRRNFKYNSYAITIPRYFYRFIGIKDDEKDYYDYLSSMDRELGSLGNLYIKVDNGFDKNIKLKVQNKLDDIWRKVKLKGDFDSSYIIELLSDNGLLPNVPNEVLYFQMKNNLKGLLEYYSKSREDFTFEKVKIIVNYIVHWVNLYVKKLFLNFNYDEINPKILYYGEITKEEVFFLIFLSTIGCDILYYNPRDCGVFEEIDNNNAFSKEVLYEKRIDIKAFPKYTSERIETTAYNAKEKINKNLFSEEGKFYRPWQFAEHYIENVTLKTTYDEIKIWMKEKAYIRDGWKVENNKVYIPNIFAKISGTHNDLDKYWNEVNDVLKQNQTKFYNKLPITGVIHLEYGKFNEIFPDESYAEFDTRKLLNAYWWKYKDLRTGLQRNMAEKIKELCLNPSVINKEDEEFRDFQVEIFSVLINLDISFMEMLQANDYAEEVPKIIIYNNEKNGNLSFEDCVMLTFMNRLGIDIIIYNPSGYNDIENYIYPDSYDIHRLENVAFRLDFKKNMKKKGFLKRFFGI